MESTSFANCLKGVICTFFNLKHQPSIDSLMQFNTAKLGATELLPCLRHDNKTSGHRNFGETACYQNGYK